MRVTFVTTHYPPSRGFGGVCESSHGLTRALARAGVAVDVVTSDASKGKRIPFQAFSKFEQTNLRIYPFKYFFSGKNGFSYDAVGVLRKLVPQSDLIHVNGIFTHPATLGAGFARHYKKPHIVAVRNGLDPWMFKIRRARKMLGYKVYVQKDLEGADCIHATAEQEIRACHTLGLKGPFTIIPNGINPHDFKDLPRPDIADERWPVLKGKTVVLFLSRLSPQKGLDMLISAWGEIIINFPDAFLVVAGPDYMGYSNQVRQLAAKSAYPGSMLIPGGVWGEQKLALYSRADVFVLPSYSENFGNVIAEALVCGTPVITTQATPWNEIEKVGCGQWITVGKKELTAAIAQMVSIPDSERKTMGQRGRELILQHYTWDIAARKMITVYRAIINGKKIPLYANPCNVEL